MNSSDPGTLANLSRYEARLERSFYKALRELQRLKALRPQAQPEPRQPAKERVPAPRSGRARWFVSESRHARRPAGLSGAGSSYFEVPGEPSGCARPGKAWKGDSP